MIAPTGRRLAAAGLAHQAQRLARVHVEGDVVDRLADLLPCARTRPCSTGKYFASPRPRASDSSTALTPARGYARARSPRRPRSGTRPDGRPAIDRSSGTSVAADVLRVRAPRVERAPGGTSMRLGGCPLIGHSSPFSVDVMPRQRVHAAPTCRGAAARRRSRRSRAVLDRLARVHDEDLVGHVGDDAEVVRDHDDRRAGALLQLLHQFEDLRLDRHVERGRRLVGDQDVGVARERHRDHRALAHAAGELVRVVPTRCLGMRDAHQLEQLDRAVAAPPSWTAPCAAMSGSPIWFPTRYTGFSDVIGSWKIIAISLPRILRISSSAHRDQRVALEVDVTALDLARAAWG